MLLRFYSVGRKPFGLAVLVMLLASLVSACHHYSTRKPDDRTVTVKPEQVQQAMAFFLVSVGKIDELVSKQSTEGGQTQAIIQLLGELERNTELLGAGNFVANHARLNDHIHQLKADLVTARAALERDPPLYYWVGRLSGSCTVCHSSP